MCRCAPSGRSKAPGNPVPSFSTQNLIGKTVDMPEPKILEGHATTSPVATHFVPPETLLAHACATLVAIPRHCSISKGLVSSPGVNAGSFTGKSAFGGPLPACRSVSPEAPVLSAGAAEADGCGVLWPWALGSALVMFPRALSSPAWTQQPCFNTQCFSTR